MSRKLLHGHPFLSRWESRHTLAVSVLAGLLLLVSVNVDPRIRAGVRYAHAPTRVVVPVTGVTPTSIASTWHAPRSGGRKHLGADIFAPRGTAVVSAVDGVIWAMHRNELGGNIVWVLGEGPAMYYYAHLDAWAPDLAPGDRVRAGTVLGSIGSTGNADARTPHLHFGITSLTIFGSRDVDPVPRLAGAKVLPAQMLANGSKEPPPKHGKGGGREVLAITD